MPHESIYQALELLADETAVLREVMPRISLGDLQSILRMSHYAYELDAEQCFASLLATDPCFPTFPDRKVFIDVHDALSLATSLPARNVSDAPRCVLAAACLLHLSPDGAYDHSAASLLVPARFLGARVLVSALRFILWHMRRRCTLSVDGHLVALGAVLMMAQEFACLVEPESLIPGSYGRSELFRGILSGEKGLIAFLERLEESLDE